MARVPASQSAPTCRGRRDEARAKVERAIRAELEASAATIVTHLAQQPDSHRGLLLADLLVALLGEGAPTLLRAAARRVRRVPPDAPERAMLFSLGAGLWRRLADDEALDDTRAEAIAARIAPGCDLPALLFLFEQQARRAGLARAASAFAAALDQRFTDFRARRQQWPIDRSLLARIGLESGVKGLTLRFHPDGHLACARAGGKQGASLELEARPGSGRFTQQGKRGGYGFAIDERYADGALHSTFFSPWHDGEESSTPTEWVVWAIECAASVLQAAGRRPARRR